MHANRVWNPKLIQIPVRRGIGFLNCFFSINCFSLKKKCNYVIANEDQLIISTLVSDWQPSCKSRIMYTIFHSIIKHQRRNQYQMVNT